MTMTIMAGNVYESLSSLYKVTRRVIYDAFDVLNTWGHRKEEKRVRLSHEMKI